MAPEIIEMTGQQSSSCDIWSVAIGKGIESERLRLRPHKRKRANRSSEALQSINQLS